MITKNKIFLRFIVIFITLLTIPFPFTIIPKLEFIEDLFLGIYQIIIPWIGVNVLNLGSPIKTVLNGSGDKTYDFVLLSFLFFLAIVGTIIWTILDKKNRTYEKLNYWFLVLLRYFLGYNMIFYGMIKVIKLQFSDIPFWRLLQPFGEASSMGLAWTFLGHSVGYNIFMGLSELIGGILLFHKRTKLLGALILIPVTANIVAVNFFFDVPVKLFSLELLFMALLIVLPDLNRLANVLIFNKETKPSDYYKPFNSKKWSLSKEILKWGFVVLVLSSIINYVIDGYNSRGSNSPKPKLYGLYQVNKFVLNRDTIPPLFTDQKRWKYIFIEYDGSIQFSKMDDSRYGLKAEVDTLEHQIRLTEFNNPDLKNVLYYKKTDSTLTINGIFRKDTVFCTTKRLDKKDFRLTSGGFRWINEYPYNR